jgi:hypothetical protein
LHNSSGDVSKHLHNKLTAQGYHRTKTETAAAAVAWLASTT